MEEDGPSSAFAGNNGNMEFDDGEMDDNRGQILMGDENSLAMPSVSVNENSNSLAMMEC